MDWQILFLLPVVLGSLYWVATSVCVYFFFKPSPSPSPNLGEGRGEGPFVSLIKPVCGPEKNLYADLATALRQDYPDYEVIYSVQSAQDPALEILRRLEKENPGRKIQVVVDETSVGPNGRLSNIHNAVLRAKGSVIVFSDSDMSLSPDYLRVITAPLADKNIGVSCTLYKAWGTKNLWEKLELLSFNADFAVSMVFATVTGASMACPGASTAVRRDVLEAIGGLAPLGDYLVEDFELGKRIREKGFRIKILPYVADTGVELKRFRDWWRHQLYWDQNTRAAAPVGSFLTLLVRAIPFALFYFLLGGKAGAVFLAGALGLRWLTAALNARLLKDGECLRALWLLPLRDILGFFVWFASFAGREIHWKGRVFVVKQGIMKELTTDN